MLAHNASTSRAIFMSNLHTGNNILELWKKWRDKKTYGEGENKDLAFKLITDCFFRQTEKLKLSNLGLKTLPEYLPPAIKELDIQGNKLTQLPDNLPLNLEKLNASDNKLVALQKNLLESITCIILANNLFEEIPYHLPSKLIILDLSSNDITAIHHHPLK